MLWPTVPAFLLFPHPYSSSTATATAKIIDFEHRFYTETWKEQRNFKALVQLCISLTNNLKTAFPYLTTVKLSNLHFGTFGISKSSFENALQSWSTLIKGSTALSASVRKCQKCAKFGILALLAFLNQVLKMLCKVDHLCLKDQPLYLPALGNAKNVPNLAFWHFWHF